jgi:SAM-dependent methyltransferase
MVLDVAEEVIWHDLECGGYRADLPLWRELAGEHCSSDGAAVLDIGAGTGRVSIDLAQTAHDVTAIDLEPLLVAELNRRARELPIVAVAADGRDFQLQRRGHGLCLVPMQTIQLLRGTSERRALFEHARAHLRPGAPVACAIVTDVDQFDATKGGLGPSPERVRLGDSLYISRAVRVTAMERFIRIERERFVTATLRSGEERGESEPDRPIEANIVELERVTEAQLHEDGRAAGLTPEPTRVIAETHEHTASEVVMFRA